MATYTMLYCVYDPGSFIGYRTKTVEADSLEEADQKAHAQLERLAGKCVWEYRLLLPSTAPRLYDTKQRKRL